MIPEALRDILARWDPADAQKPGSGSPRVLYTIPNGGNPTGASMTAERKQEVYEVVNTAEGSLLHKHAKTGVWIEVHASHKPV